MYVVKNYLCWISEQKANSSIALKQNVRLSVSVKTRRTGADVTLNALNISISKHANGIRPILITVTREDLRISNF